MISIGTALSSALQHAVVAWIYLLIARALEVLWAIGMKDMQGFTRPGTPGEPRELPSRFTQQWLATAAEAGD